ncbi:unnamed protein product [Alopecurus aequalis]
MATTAEGHRRRKNRSRNKKTEAAATTVLDLPDHLLERVLLCLGPSSCLVHAAAACRRWCHLVADAGFLAHLCTAHPHAMRVGNYHNVNFSTRVPVFVPIPSSPLGIDVYRFALDDFLPDIGKDYSWQIADSRGSLLLLVLCTSTGNYCRDLLVCEPLTRRRQGIFLPPDFSFYLGMFLVDGDDAGRQLGLSNFRIIGAVDEALTCVFSPGSDGGWRLVRNEATSEADLPWSGDDTFVGRANGSIYWGIGDNDGTEVLVLNETTVEYSIVSFPDEIWGPYVQWNRDSWVIGGEDNILRIVRLLGNDLKVFAQRHSCTEDGDNKWILEKELVGLAEATIGLPGHEETFFEQGAMIVAANAEYILLTPILTPPPEKAWLFSLELDTMRVERGHERSKYEGAAYMSKLPCMAAGVA